MVLAGTSGRNEVAYMQPLWAIDPDGALVAVCYLGSIGGPNLNAWLVANGWALAYRPESEAYVAQEEGARHAGRGLWRGDFVEPWLWSGPR